MLHSSIFRLTQSKGDGVEVKPPRSVPVQIRVVSGTPGLKISVGPGHQANLADLLFSLPPPSTFFLAFNHLRFRNKSEQQVKHHHE